ncbi:MAG: agmatine deiminase family protein [Deltaproteobacteria bacterium]|nr:agmatine deiminase family protein [Deltaproteobacteria bacterium]
MKDNPKKKRYFPPEWAPQSGVQLTFPHANTDWSPYLDEATNCFNQIARAVSSREKLIAVLQNDGDEHRLLAGCNLDNVLIVRADSNDTWARDHGGITVFENNLPRMLDFTFNGWGKKFSAEKDNCLTHALFCKGCFGDDVSYENRLDFVLEGGSIESDGNGTLLTTADCLLSKNRNDSLSKAEIEQYLAEAFGVSRVLWLQHGFLAGDDTDSHIDTLARFCDARTIAYVKCEDKTDMHYDAMKRMEDELRQFRTIEGAPYRLAPLPMADPMFDDGDRLPATYANFLIINGAVLMPAYNSAKDAAARAALARVFPDREIVAIDCSVLVRQHGSLHCVTMQYPEGVLR